jgi:hypothetical protein
LLEHPRARIAIFRIISVSHCFINAQTLRPPGAACRSFRADHCHSGFETTFPAVLDSLKSGGCVIKIHSAN